MLACQRTQQVHLLLTVNHPAGSQHASSSVSLGVTEHLYTIHPSAGVRSVMCHGALCLPAFIRDWSPLCIINTYSGRSESGVEVIGHTFKRSVGKDSVRLSSRLRRFVPREAVCRRADTVGVVSVMDKMSEQR